MAWNSLLLLYQSFKPFLFLLSLYRAPHYRFGKRRCHWSLQIGSARQAPDKKELIRPWLHGGNWPTTDHMSHSKSESHDWTPLRYPYRPCLRVQADVFRDMDSIRKPTKGPKAEEFPEDRKWGSVHRSRPDMLMALGPMSDFCLHFN
jgi:hypothetical protein